MGGNALQTLHGKGRMRPEEYKRVKEEVLKQLSRWYEQVHVPPETFDKLDYGDVDVVCLCRDSDEDASPDIDLILKQNLGSTEVVRNAHLTSFEFLGRQIDLTQVRTHQAMDFKLVFNSYGVVGTLLAVMCKSLGLLINAERLAVSLLHLSAPNLLLTHDIWQVLQFLGLSGDVWKCGFSDCVSLCHWFALSRFFNPQDFLNVPKCVLHQSKPVQDIFAMLASLAISDNETDKVKSISLIVDNPLAIKTMQGCVVQSADPLLNIRMLHPSKEDVLAEALSFFSKEDEYQALLSMRDQCRKAKLKFNGELVMQWTGCSKKDLGRLLPAFKECYSPSDILSMDEDTIKHKLFSLIQSLSVDIKSV